MYWRFLRDKTVMSGKARRRSPARRSITLRAPALGALSLQDLVADLPVELDQGPVGRERTNTSAPDPDLMSSTSCPFEAGAGVSPPAVIGGRLAGEVVRREPEPTGLCSRDVDQRGADGRGEGYGLSGVAEAFEMELDRLANEAVHLFAAVADYANAG